MCTLLDLVGHNKLLIRIFPTPRRISPARLSVRCPTHPCGMPHRRSTLHPNAIINISMPLPPRQALLDLLATLSFRLGDFTLASGQKSDYYIDCRTTTLHAEGGRLAGLVLYDLIRDHFPHALAVGGLTMGADPLVSNTASASAWALADHTEIAELSAQFEDPDLRDQDPGPAPTLIHGFLVRKAEKTHGTGRRIEGFLHPGAPVVIVDDVCTTGGSTITAIEATREAGMTIAGVLCLVDRLQGGRENIERALAELPSNNNAPVPFHAVFTHHDVRHAHLALQR
jgi:orotate phosphoribosyltransferase